MTAPPQMLKFDPADHPGNLYEAFGEFIDSFQYEYEAIAKAPPTGTTDTAAWTQQDKRKQLLGRFSSRNFQRDFEDETSLTERAGITFDQLVAKMKARYKPTQNVTLAHYEFRKLTQQPLESFDAFINRVKHEANYCQFQCNGDCTVQNTLIRDQIIYGVMDNEIRKGALNEQWTLDDLQKKGRQIEAATLGAAKIKKESQDPDPNSNSNQLRRTQPGKYSKKKKKGRKTTCGNCSNTTCAGGTQCFGYGRKCFDCNEYNHLQNARNCKKKKDSSNNKSEKAMRVSDGKNENSDEESRSESDSDADVND